MTLYVLHYVGTDSVFDSFEKADEARNSLSQALSLPIRYWRIVQSELNTVN